MASGFLHFRKKSHIAGVILNRVSSMYYERLAAAVEEASGLPVLGYLPESEEYRMESRHLGLFLPGEIDRLRERIGRLADQMEKSIAVERVLEVAGMLPLRIENKEKEKAENESMEAESIAKFPACQEQKVTSRVRIGVARDEAFCFYYQENFRLLEQMGAELVYFSPLRDKKSRTEWMGFYLAAVIRRIMHGSWQRTRRCVRVSGGRLRRECRFWRNAVDFYIYTVLLKEAMENTGKWLAFIHLTLTGRTACAGLAMCVC